MNEYTLVSLELVYDIDDDEDEGKSIVLLDAEKHDDEIEVEVLELLIHDEVEDDQVIEVELDEVE